MKYSGGMMTPDDLAKLRAEYVHRLPELYDRIPQLIAEIERLQAENEQLKNNYDDTWLKEYLEDDGYDAHTDWRP